MNNSFNWEDNIPIELMNEFSKENVITTQPQAPVTVSSIHDASAGNVNISYDEIFAAAQASDDISAPLTVDNLQLQQLLNPLLSKSSLSSGLTESSQLTDADSLSPIISDFDLLSNFPLLADNITLNELVEEEELEEESGIVPGDTSSEVITATTESTGTGSDNMEPIIAYSLQKEYIDKPIKSNTRKRQASETSMLVPEDLTCEKGTSGKKKTKMYELPNKSDPLVQRAGYAKSYREKKKAEKESIKSELDTAKKELQDAMDKITELEAKNRKQETHIQAFNIKFNKKDKEVMDLKRELKQEQEKNALNPEQTETLCDMIQSVVKAACPPNVTVVNVIVPERLANKKVAAMGTEKILKIGSEANLQDKSCAFTFDLDDKNNKFFVRKIE